MQEEHNVIKKWLSNPQPQQKDIQEQELEDHNILIKLTKTDKNKIEDFAKKQKLKTSPFIKYHIFRIIQQEESQK